MFLFQGFRRECFLTPSGWFQNSAVVGLSPIACCQLTALLRSSISDLGGGGDPLSSLTTDWLNWVHLSNQCTLPNSRSVPFCLLACFFFKLIKGDEMVGWHHQLDGYEFEQALGAGDRQGSLAYCIPWGRKESNMTEQLNWWLKGKRGGRDILGVWDPLTKGMATHSSILAWRISWTEEPVRLHSWSHRESDTTEAT